MNPYPVYTWKRSDATVYMVMALNKHSAETKLQKHLGITDAEQFEKLLHSCKFKLIIFSYPKGIAIVKI